LKRTGSVASILAILLFIALLTGLVWGIFRFNRFNIGGGGFSIQWIGIHSLITEGGSPYSDHVTSQIESSGTFFNSYLNTTISKYTSPLYSAFIVFPFAVTRDQTVSRPIWLFLELLAIIAIFVLGLKLTGWKPSWYIISIFTFFSLVSFHVLVPWLDGGLSIWATLFLVLSLLALSQNRSEVSGVLLGLSTVQPEMAILPVIFVLIWAASQRKRIILLWFFITIIFLSVIGLFIVPDWIIQYVRILVTYKQNFPPGSPMVLFSNQLPGLGRQLGWLLSAIMILLLLFEWWRALRKEFRWCLWTTCLTIVISQWIGIPTVPTNLIVLLLPMILISAMLAERWPRGGSWVAVLLSVVLFAWEWDLVYLDYYGGHTNTLLNLLIPLPLLLFIGLYWVRWWAIRPRRLLIEEIRFGDSY
jgi:hypothetical protein